MAGQSDLDDRGKSPSVTMELLSYPSLEGQLAVAMLNIFIKEEASQSVNLNSNSS